MRVLLVSLLVACLTACAQQPVAPTTDPLAKLSAGWNQMKPGGETSCSDGSAYSFFVRPGDPNKLMVYFEGGGACWFRKNCDTTLQPTYKVNLAGQNLDNARGIFDFSHQDNPFASYTIVYAPYCSGDVHLGRTDHAYPPESGQTGDLTIRHRGVTNTDAVLDWAYANVTSPQTVFVTGSSAGSIPSPFYAYAIGEHYKDARIVQLGDGSGGYRRRDGANLPHTQWGSVKELQKSPAYADVDDQSFNYEELYIRAAKARPDIQFAAYDAAEDAVQKKFLALSGVKDVSLLELISANQTDIRAAAPGFRSFIAGGDSHTVLMRPEFYTFRVGDVAIRDWVANLAEGKAVIDAHCTECVYPELIGASMPAPMAALWKEWEGPKQAVAPFWIFDNVGYVGIDWVAAYVIKTSDGLILIDSLYGKWVPHLEAGLRTLGLNPADVRYVLSTHGHIDHAGGAAYFQKRYGARVVMSKNDWSLAAEASSTPYFVFPVPSPDIVANDGDQIVLGDTTVSIIATPGHTPGAISFRYSVQDGEESHEAITLGGVGLNFSGVPQTQMYIHSYERLQKDSAGVSVSLPNHAAMGNVFKRRDALATRQAGDLHPFVDAQAYSDALVRFLAAAHEKLANEKDGTAEDAITTLTKTLKQ